MSRLLKNTVPFHLDKYLGWLVSCATLEEVVHCRIILLKLGDTAKHLGSELEMWPPRNIWIAESHVIADKWRSFLKRANRLILETNDILCLL
jgi:hypothetical protein